jgi:hypothetical protein
MSQCTPSITIIKKEKIIKKKEILEIKIYYFESWIDSASNYGLYKCKSSVKLIKHRLKAGENICYLEDVFKHQRAAEPVRIWMSTSKKRIL